MQKLSSKFPSSSNPMYKPYNIKLRRPHDIQVDESHTSQPTNQVPRNTDDVARTDVSDTRSDRTEESEEEVSGRMGTEEPGREETQAALT